MVGSSSAADEGRAKQQEGRGPGDDNGDLSGAEGMEGSAVGHPSDVDAWALVTEEVLKFWYRVIRSVHLVHHLLMAVVKCMVSAGCPRDPNVIPGGGSVFVEAISREDSEVCIHKKVQRNVV